MESYPGQALVAGRMLVEGSRRRGWDRIASESESLGMDLAAFGGPEAIGLSIDALAADWRQALVWAAELTLDPAFPADRIDWVCRQAAGELDSLAERPEIVAGWAFQQQLYAPHPWSRPPQGSTESLATLDRKKVIEFYRDSLSRGLLVSVVGDVVPQEVDREAERLFGAVTETFRISPSALRPSVVAPCDQRVEVPMGDQAHLYVGRLTVPVTDPDRVALQVAAVVLGAGPGLVGRIPERVREADGLAYVTQVATVAGAGTVAGRMTVYLATATQNVERARRAVVEELERLVVDGVRSHELEMAKRYLLGSAPFRRETAAQVAALQAQACFFDQPYDREDWFAEQIRAVDRERLDDVVRRHLGPERLLTTIGLPRDALADRV